MLNGRFRSVRSAIGLIAVGIIIATTAPMAARPAGKTGPSTMTAYGHLPVAFVENQGQTDTRVRYYAQGPRYAFSLTRDEVLLSFLDEPRSGGLTLGLRFPGSNARARLEGEERMPGDVNYFQGADSSAWRTSIPRYAQAVYRDLWPGVDLRLREHEGTLKYEFRVRPGARPSDIRLAYAGATGLSLDKTGALLIATSMGTLRDSPPVAYQTINGVRVPVESRYVMSGTKSQDAQYGFAVGRGYRPDQELIIDPG